MHTEAKHSLSRSIIYTNVPKDHHDEGKDFAQTDLLASSLGTCVIIIMGIETKLEGANLIRLRLVLIK